MRVKGSQSDFGSILSVRSARMSVLMTVHNYSTQYNTEQFTPTLQTIITAPVFSMGADGSDQKKCSC